MLTFEHSGMRFSVEPSAAGSPFSYKGYCDGQLSLTAARADIAARALLRKHVCGLPQGELVDLPAERLRRRGA